MAEVGSLYIRLKADASEFSRAMESASEKVANIGQSMVGFGAKASIVGAGLGLAFKGVLSSASDFESSFAGVRKTVDMTDEGFGTLAQGIRDMAKEVPASASSIADVVSMAGQLGVSNEHLLSFSRTMIDLGESTNLSSEEAATSLARLANITGMSQEDFGRLGSTIVGLGNNFATTESEIVGMGLRLAGAGAQIGLTEPQILGIATALSSVGISAEAGGTAFSRVMVNMANSVATGDEKLAGFARTAGMSVDEFSTLFKTNAAGALEAFVGGLDNVSKSGGNVFETLDELGLGEIRVRDALLRAAGASDMFSDAIRIGSEAWGENTALTNEAAERYKTSASQMQIMRNKLNDVAIQLGSVLIPIILSHVLPAFERLIGYLQRGVDWFSNLSERGKTIGLVVAGLAIAIGPLIIAFGTMMLMLSAIMSPITLIVVGIAALAAGFVYAYTQVDWFRNAVDTGIRAVVTAFQTAWPLIVQGVQIAFETIRTIVQTVWPIIQEVISTAWATIQTIIATAVPIILEIVTTAFSMIQTIATTAWPIIQEVIATAWTVIQTIISTALPIIIEIVTTAFATVQSIVETVWPIIQSVVETAVAVIQTIITNVFPVVAEIATQAFGAIRDFATEIWPQIQEIVSVAVEIVQTVTQQAWDAISAVTNAVWPVVQTVVETAVNAIGAVVGAVWPVIQSVIETVLGVIQSVVETVMGIVSSVWSEKHEEIKSLASTVWDTIKELIRGALDIIQGVLETVMGLISGDWQRAWDGIKQVAEGVWTALKSLITLAIAAVRTAISVGLTAVKNVFTTAWDGIKNTVSTAIDRVVELVRGLPGRITSALGNLGSLLVQAGRDLIGGLISGITSRVGDLISTLGSITDRLPSWKGPPDRDAVLLEPSGMLIMEGLDRGLERGEGQIRRRLEQLTGEFGDWQLSGGVGGAGLASDGVTVEFNGPVEILATDRRDAERSAGDVGWAVSQTLKSRGL